MAKKRAGRGGGINMAEEIREALKVNRNLSNNEALEIVQAKYPKEDINANSFGVAVTGARRKLGIKAPRGRKVRRRKPGRPPGSGNKTTASKVTVNLDALQAARKYVKEVGNAEKAIAAIKQLETLQIS